ncbi:MAG: hypothetical protein LBR26_15950 [Prevotella sp.]|nr:hypothetical protein [Prevotella sp.]
MKKSFLFIPVMCFSFYSCDSETDKQRIAELENDISSLRIRIEDNEDEISKLNYTVEDLDQRLDNMIYQLEWK